MLVESRNEKNLWMDNNASLNKPGDSNRRKSHCWYCCNHGPLSILSQITSQYVSKSMISLQSGMAMHWESGLSSHSLISRTESSDASRLTVAKVVSRCFKCLGWSWSCFRCFSSNSKDKLDKLNDQFEHIWAKVWQLVALFFTRAIEEVSFTLC